MQGPEFKSQYHQKKKKVIKEVENESIIPRLEWLKLRNTL
jgi:hypothetical protein